MKNSELTYKEIYGQPVSFQAVNDTLDTIFKTLDEAFAEKYDEVIFTGCGTSLYLAQASAHASPPAQVFLQKECAALSCTISQRLM